MPEDAALTSLANNPPMMEALKEALLKEFRQIDSDAEYDDVRLGQMYRARIVGVEVVDSVFKRVARLKSGGEKEPRVATHR